MDNLEKFIRDNRSSFDSEDVPKHSWNNIEDRIPSNNRTANIFNFKRVLKYAASVILLVGFGFLLGINKPPAETVSFEYPAYVEAEQRYKKQVDQKIAQLASYNPDHEINEDLDQLEDLLNDLKKELERAPHSNAEQIIHAMIENHRTRLELLELVISRIKQAQENKNLEDDQFENI